MKKIAVSVAAVTTLFATHAVAADMAAKAPPPVAPAPVYNWTGWYIGLNAGASMGTAKTDYSVGALSPSPGFAGNMTSSPSGFIGGGQLGYNWQMSPLWVAGIEADIQWAREGDHNTANQPFCVGCAPAILAVVLPSISGTGAIDLDTKIDWFGTVTHGFRR